MSPSRVLSVAAVALSLFAGAPRAQQPDRRPPAPSKDVYSERVVFEGSTTIQTGTGPKQLSIVIKKVRIEGGRKSAKLPLLDQGFAILQHRAGTLEVTLGEQRSKPLEGEWLTVALPQTVTVQSEDDTAQFDLIVLTERRKR
jgi:hypothetical protein